MKYPIVVESTRKGMTTFYVLTTQSMYMRVGEYTVCFVVLLMLDYYTYQHTTYPHIYLPFCLHIVPD